MFPRARPWSSEAPRAVPVFCDERSEGRGSESEPAVLHSGRRQPTALPCVLLPDVVCAPPKDPGAHDRAFQARSEVRGFVLEGRPLPTKHCAEDASSTPPCWHPWVAARRRGPVWQREVVSGSRDITSRPQGSGMQGCGRARRQTDWRAAS